MANGRPLDPTGKALSLSSKSSPRADSSASAPTRPIKEPLRTDLTVSRYVISPAARKKRKEEEKDKKKEPGEHFRRLFRRVTSQMRRSHGLSDGHRVYRVSNVSSALKLQIMKRKRRSRDKSKLKAERQ